MEKRKIRLIDRTTGQVMEEKIEGEWLLRLLYESHPRASSLLRETLCSNAFFSKLMAFFQNSPFSVRKIEKFINHHGLNRSHFLKENFTSFNDFFVRQLKEGAREIAKEALVMPADGRYLAYESFRTAKEIIVKGTKLSLFELLGRNQNLTQKYNDGPFVIARLAPCDYHRFHFPVEGVPEKPIDISGKLHSVNPISLYFSIKALTENKRSLVELKTPNLGDVLIIPVGALFVGSIHFTYTPLTPVKKGDEMGYFSFGGSTIILLFEPGKIELAQDLLENTAKGLETLALMGECLGRKK